MCGMLNIIIQKTLRLYQNFFKKVEYLEKRKNGIKIELFTGFKDKYGNDIYFGDKVKEWIPDEMEDEGGYRLESEVKQINGCAVLMEIGFDYSDSKFPDDFTFLYEDVTEIEIIEQ